MDADDSKNVSVPDYRQCKKESRIMFSCMSTDIVPLVLILFL